MRLRNRNKCEVRESDEEIEFVARLSRAYRARKFCYGVYGPLKRS